jgi:DNA excision repair protein ERCC-5
LPKFTSDLDEQNFENAVRERIVATPSENAYEEIQELLTAFGIPWVSAPADAEAQCAFLCAAGLADGVISDDSDTLIYGSPIVFRHLYIGESTVELFKLNQLGFNRDELISLALLLGCDFTEGVRGIGPVNATEIVRVYSGIDGLRRFRDWADRLAADAGKESEPLLSEEGSPQLREFKLKHANYRAQWIFPDDFPSQEVWDVFAVPLVSTDMTPFTWARPDEQLVVDTVTAMTDMKEEVVDQILSATMTQYRQTQLQRRITDYFSPAFERGTVAEVVSKRLQSALAHS